MGEKYLSHGAHLSCNQGADDRTLRGNIVRMHEPGGSSYINEDDAVPFESIPEFGTCVNRWGATYQCIPDIVEHKWRFVAGEKTIGGEPAVTMTAACQCASGGLITPV